MLAKLLGKIADMPKKWAIVYISTIVISYIVGMILVIYGVVVVGNGTDMNNVYFWAGLGVWVPTCVATVLTALSSNYGKEIEKKEEQLEEKVKKTNK